MPSAAQRFPRYRYASTGERIDNITDWAERKFRERYGAKAGVSKDAIFAYVYAATTLCWRETYQDVGRRCRMRGNRRVMPSDRGLIRGRAGGRIRSTGPVGGGFPAAASSVAWRNRMPVSRARGVMPANGAAASARRARVIPVPVESLATLLNRRWRRLRRASSADGERGTRRRASPSVRNPRAPAWAGA